MTDAHEADDTPKAALLRSAASAGAGGEVSPRSPAAPAGAEFEADAGQPRPMLPASAPLEPAPPRPARAPARRPSPRRMALALLVAALSDALAWLVDLVPPLQWALDAATAALLFLILGRRWALLPGLVAEAIPGLGVFPFWILVVLSIILYDDIRRRRPLAHS